MSRGQTLDVVEPQVLIDFWDDAAGYYWHHRLLLRKGSDSRWIVATPDLEVQHEDLGTHRVIPLARDAKFPADKASATYAFDSNISAPELAQLRADADALAEVLGFAAVAANPGAVKNDSHWRVADPAKEAFGEVVPDAALGDPAASVLKDDVGLLLIDKVWTMIERVKDAEKVTWEALKRCGPGRDARLLGDVRDKNGYRLLDFGRGLELSKKVAQPGWPYLGTSAAEEYLGNLRQLDKSLVAFDMEWRGRSGVAEKSTSARLHKDYAELAQLMLTRDQYDLVNSVSGEMVIRKLIQVEQAVRRNPKQPDYEGLDVITANLTDETGAIQTRAFASWVGEQQKNEAFVLKHNRAWHEERNNLSKKTDPQKGGGGR